MNISKADYDLSNTEEWYQFCEEVEEGIGKLRVEIRNLNEEFDRGATAKKTYKRSNNVRMSLKVLSDSIKELKKTSKRLKLSDTEKQMNLNRLEKIKDDEKELKRMFGDKSSQKRFGQFNEDVYQKDAEHTVNNYTDEQMLELQNKQMKDQDDSIDVISQHLDRIKYIGNEMSGELDEHSKLLGNLDHEVGKTNRKLKKQTQRILRIMDKATVPCGIFIIILLIIVVVVLAIIAIKTI